MGICVRNPENCLQLSVPKTLFLQEKSITCADGTGGGRGKGEEGRGEGKGGVNTPRASACNPTYKRSKKQTKLLSSLRSQNAISAKKSVTRAGGTGVCACVRVCSGAANGVGGWVGGWEGGRGGGDGCVRLSYYRRKRLSSSSSPTIQKKHARPKVALGFARHPHDGENPPSQEAATHVSLPRNVVETTPFSILPKS